MEPGSARRDLVVSFDLHTHVTPADIPAGPSQARLWPGMVMSDDGTATLTIEGKPFRSIDARSWNPAVRLDDMREQELDGQLLSPMPELLSFWLPGEDAAYLASHVNEHIAAMIGTAPGSFAGLGMVPLQDVAVAIRQLDQIERLGLRGVEVGTHVNGLPLGDAALWPFYEALEARDLSLFIHPLRPCGLDRIGGTPEVAALATFPLEIAMAAVSLMSGGVPRRFPHLRMLLSHGGGALAGMLGRLDQGSACFPSIGSALGEDATTAARRFWFDSNVYDGTTLRYLADQVGIERIVVGSDYPFALRQDRPSAFVEAALPGSSRQCTCNAAAFLGAPSAERPFDIA